MAKAIVLYNTKGGNTEQIAKQIAEGLEDMSEDVSRLVRMRRVYSNRSR